MDQAANPIVQGSFKLCLDVQEGNASAIAQDLDSYNTSQAAYDSGAASFQAALKGLTS